MAAPNMVVKSVCGACNNGWMSELEAAVRPLITALWRQRKVQLSPTQQAKLVRWCQKTLAVLDLWMPEVSVVRDDVYQALAEGQPVPGTWDIRVARVTPDQVTYFSHVPTGPRTIAEKVPEEDEVLPELNLELVGVQSSFAIGDILFIVRYSPHVFRGETAIDGDWAAYDWVPPALLGRGKKSTFKRGGLPVYSGEDLDFLAIWSAAKDPQVTIPAVGRDPDGTTWVDDIATALGPDYEQIERHSGAYDVQTMLAQEVVWDLDA